MRSARWTACWPRCSKSAASRSTIRSPTTASIRRYAESGGRPAETDLPPYGSSRVDVLRVPEGMHEPDRVAVEEPLEIRVNGVAIAVTMRTPGHDEELALGFCLSEGIVPADARLPDDLAANTVEVSAPGFDPAVLRRSFYTTSSCGVCGKGSLEAVAVEAPIVDSTLRIGS